MENLAPISSTAPDNGYSLENARAFGWNSISGDLLPERVDLLNRYVVGRTVLDAGCGGGAFVDHLTGGDFKRPGWTPMTSFSGLHPKDDSGGGSFKQIFDGPLPFTDGFFDTTICLDVLEHVNDDRYTIRELARVTRRRLVIAVPQEDRWMPRYRLIFYPYRDPTHRRYYTPESLQALATSLGARHVEVFGEQQIPLHSLALQLLHPHSRYPGLTRVYQRLFTFLVHRSSSTPLYQNLAAVVDLEPARKEAACALA